MSFFSDNVLSRRGDAISGAYITVYAHKTKTKVPLYVDPEMQTLGPNPVRSDKWGNYQLNLHPAVVDIEIDAVGQVLKTMRGVGIGTDLSGGKPTIDSLGDVEIDAGTLTLGDILEYAADQKFHNIQPNFLKPGDPLPYALEDLTDVAPGGGNGDVLTLGAGGWVAQAPASLVNVINDLGDVDDSGKADQSLLGYDATSFKWVAKALNAIPFGSLSGVDLAGASNGNVLTFDTASSTWKPQVLTLKTSLAALDDAVVTTPSANDLLRWNPAAGAGGAWINFVPTYLLPADLKTELTAYYKRAAVDSALALKADIGNVYSKTETEGKISTAVSGKADQTDLTDLTKTVHDKMDAAALQPLLDMKANVATTYSKTEVDGFLAGKAATGHLHALGDLSDTDVPAPADQAALTWVAADGKWKAVDIPTELPASTAADSAKLLVVSSTGSPVWKAPTGADFQGVILGSKSAGAPPHEFVWADLPAPAASAAGQFWAVDFDGTVPAGVTNIVSIAGQSIKPGDWVIMGGAGGYSVLHAAAVGATLNGLPEVEVATPADKQVLTYEGLTGKWKNQALPTPQLNDNSDVTLAGITPNQVLTFDPSVGGGKWVNKSIPAGTLGGLKDVNSPAPGDQQVLSWSAGPSEWVSRTLPPLPNMALFATQVDLTNSATGLRALIDTKLDKTALPPPPDLTPYLLKTEFNLKLGLHYTKAEIDARPKELPAYTVADAGKDLSVSAAGALVWTLPKQEDFRGVIVATPTAGVPHEFSWATLPAPATAGRYWVVADSGAVPAGVPGIAVGTAAVTGDWVIDTGAAFTFISASRPGVTLAGLPEVTLTGPADTQVLTFDGTTSRWINKALPPAASPTTTLAALTDTDVKAGVAVGDLLRYNAASQWESFTPPIWLVAADIAGKADTTYVDTELAKKADGGTTYSKTEVDTALGLKADKAYVDTELGKKADLTALTTGLAAKADQATTFTKVEVTAALGLKTDKTYVDTELGKKADLTAMNAGLALKADLATTYTKTAADAKFRLQTAVLNDIPDVVIGAPAADQFLGYVTAGGGQWVNRVLPKELPAYATPADSTKILTVGTTGLVWAKPIGSDFAGVLVASKTPGVAHEFEWTGLTPTRAGRFWAVAEDGTVPAGGIHGLPAGEAVSTGDWIIDSGAALTHIAAAKAGVTLGGLPEIDIAGPSAGQALVFSAGSKWANRQLSIRDLSDVQPTATIQADQLLKWDGAGHFVNFTPAWALKSYVDTELAKKPGIAHTHAADDLTDVDTSTTAPKALDVLSFDGTSSKWIPKALPAPPNLTVYYTKTETDGLIAPLATAAALAAGLALKAAVGAAYTKAESDTKFALASHAHALGDLSNVTLGGTPLQSGDALTYDTAGGGTWINTHGFIQKNLTFGLIPDAPVTAKTLRDLDQGRSYLFPTEHIDPGGGAAGYDRSKVELVGIHDHRVGMAYLTRLTNEQYVLTLREHSNVGNQETQLYALDLSDLVLDADVIGTGVNSFEKSDREALETIGHNKALLGGKSLIDSVVQLQRELTGHASTAGETLAGTFAFYHQTGSVFAILEDSTVGTDLLDGNEHWVNFTYKAGESDATIGDNFGLWVEKLSAFKHFVDASNGQGLKVKDIKGFIGHGTMVKVKFESDTLKLLEVSHVASATATAFLKADGSIPYTAVDPAGISSLSVFVDQTGNFLRWKDGAGAVSRFITQAFESENTALPALKLTMPTTPTVASQEWRLNGSLRAAMHTKDHATSLIFDSADFGDGQLAPSIKLGRNTNAGAAGPTPPFIQLQDAAGVYQSLWFDKGGRLRTGLTAPRTSTGATGKVDSETGGQPFVTQEFTSPSISKPALKLSMPASATADSFQIVDGAGKRQLGFTRDHRLELGDPLMVDGAPYKVKLLVNAAEADQFAELGRFTGHLHPEEVSAVSPLAEDSLGVLVSSTVHPHATKDSNNAIGIQTFIPNVDSAGSTAKFKNLVGIRVTGSPNDGGADSVLGLDVRAGGAAIRQHRVAKPALKLSMPAAATADSFQIMDGAGAKQVVVDKDGKLGIGGDPTTQLHVKAPTGSVTVEGTSSYSYLNLRGDRTGLGKGIGLINALRESTMIGGFEIGTGPVDEDSGYFAVKLKAVGGVATERLRLQPSGRMGLGNFGSGRGPDWDAQLDIRNPETSVPALKLSMPAGSTTHALQLFYNGALNFSVSMTATIKRFGFEPVDAGNDQSGPYCAVGRNTNSGPAGPAPGSLMLTSASGSNYHLWADNSGKLRIGPDPTGSTAAATKNSETTGTVVGTQT